VARRKGDSPIDLRHGHDLTAGRIDALTCPLGLTQAFMRDTQSPGLRVRVTPSGAKSFVFEGKLNRRTIRLTIGDVRSWAIPKARAEANRLRVLLDGGIDPRDVERDRLIAVAAKRDADQRETATVGEAWTAYVIERRPQWGDLHYRDHVRKASAGGVQSSRGTRGTGITQPGPLHALMALRLSELAPAVIDAWAATEAKTRPSSARLAWRLLKVFLGWCAQHPTYAPLLAGKNPAKTTKARESLGHAAAKSDVLQREQLGVWFKYVQQLSNPVVAAALQVMLLTGARPGEVLTLRRDDVDSKWKALTIRDKVDGMRVIPLTPYVAHLLSNLPVRNGWLFASPTSASGHLTEPNSPHSRACTAAGLQGLTLHGLRRSFASLTEWLDVPTGVVAQLMGHKPSATAEKHYKVRPLELLAVHHRRIEAWMLEQAGVPLEMVAANAGPRLIQAA
jgi:integrase